MHPRDGKRRSKNCFRRRRVGDDSPPLTSQSMRHEEPTLLLSATISGEEQRDGSRRSHRSSERDSIYSDFDFVTDAMQDVFFDEDELAMAESMDDDELLHTFGSLVFPYFSDASPEATSSSPSRTTRKTKKSTAKRTRSQSAQEALQQHAAVRKVPKRVTGSSASVFLPPRVDGALGVLSVVLDLDETMVYARQGPILVRPHVGAFLRRCVELRCEIIVWTAGSASYVNPILHALGRQCGQAHWFHHLISRHKCWYESEGGGGAKDLRLLGRPLDQLVMIENNPVSIRLQPGNAVLVEDFFVHTRHGATKVEDRTFIILTEVVEHLVHELTAHTSPTSSRATPDSPKSLTTAVARLLKSDPRLQPFSFRSCDVLENAMEQSEGTPSGATETARGSHTASSAVNSHDDSTNTSSSLLRCRGLRYSPSASDASRSYGCLSPRMKDEEHGG